MSGIFDNLSMYKFDEAMILRFKERLLESSFIALLPHSSADGDALGCAFALKYFLEDLGKQAVVICPDKPAVSFFSDYIVGQIPARSPDLLIAVDSGSVDRFFYPPEFQSIFLINIDHHKSNIGYGDLNFVVPLAPSACEVLTVLLYKAFGNDFCISLVAQALLFGLLSDTQMFTTAGVCSDSLKIATFLTDNGADLQKVRSLIRQPLSFAMAKLWSSVLSDAVVVRPDCLVLSVSHSRLTREQVVADEFIGFCNFVAKLVALDVIIFLLEVEPGIVKASLRSKKFDVGSFSQSFGGGGHAVAAGFKIACDNFDDFVERVKSRYQQF